MKRALPNPIPPPSRKPRQVYREYVRMQNGEIWVEEYTLWRDKKQVHLFEPHWSNILSPELRGQGLTPLRDEA